MIKVGKLADKSPGQPYVWKDGMLYYNNHVVIPPNSALITTLLQEYHHTPLGGHSGTLQTFKSLAQQFYWPLMHKTIREYISACDSCQKAKSNILALADLLQPLLIPSHIWEDISMDFVDGLPKSEGHISIMVVVDRLTKSAHLVPLAHPYTARSVATKFIDHIIKLHGTKLCMTSAYHPQTDGQTEVVNRCIEQFRRSAIDQRWRRVDKFEKNRTWCPCKAVQ